MDSCRFRLQLPKLICLLVGCALCIPVAAWAFCKPTRVLAPELNGVSCLDEYICTDDSSRYERAAELYEEAYAFVSSSVGTIERRPRVVFCSSRECFRSFGFDEAAARTVGVSGIVIAPHGWKYYYLRHEMIHHLQAERMGVFRQWRSPYWFKEGMAYALSGDPRSDLAEPWQRYRLQFESWYRSVGMDRLWEEAGEL